MKKDPRSLHIWCRKAPSWKDRKPVTGCLVTSVLFIAAKDSQF